MRLQVSKRLNTAKQDVKVVKFDHLKMPSNLFTFAHNAKHCLAQFNKDLPNE